MGTSVTATASDPEAVIVRAAGCENAAFERENIETSENVARMSSRIEDDDPCLDLERELLEDDEEETVAALVVMPIKHM